MNTSQLARATFVLDRSTFEQLGFISSRLNVSRSELVRDVLAEPVALMAKWVLSVPDDPTDDDKARIGEAVQLDMVEFIERKASELKEQRGG
jgi:hypothetical protein